MCAFESCDKPCYIDYSGGTRRIHDYCGKQHAEKHRERIETVWPGSYQSLNIATHYQYPSSHCDRFQQHHHHGGHHYQGGHHHHGYQLRSQTGEKNNTPCHFTDMYNYNDILLCMQKIFANAVGSLQQLKFNVDCHLQSWFKLMT